MTGKTTSNPRGAGRKPAAQHMKKVHAGIALPRWLIDAMRSRPESMAVQVETALKAFYGFTSPD